MNYLKEYFDSTGISFDFSFAVNHQAGSTGL